MLATHLWNNVWADANFACVSAEYSEHVMEIIRSIANQDGVYDLVDLLIEMPELAQSGVFCEPLERILHSLIRADGLYALHDLRHELRQNGLNVDDDDFEDADGDEDEGDEEDRAVNRDPVTLSNAERLSHHCIPENLSRSERVQIRQSLTYKVAEVTISRVRVCLPEKIDVDDDGAVAAYVQANLRRVREAALECAPEDITVSDAYVYRSSSANKA